MREPERPDPDKLLARIKQREDPERGRLRVYLGAAPGVGKTFAMLQEAHRRKSRGTDVVVGVVETHGRALTAAQIGDLEIVPPREIEYRGITLTEMDTDAVLARHPQVVLVDELAHTNAPGSRNEKRYQDVYELLDAGITVIATMNVQHIESLNDYVLGLIGVAVRETVPDRVLDVADQVELIDMAPEALIRRMEHGHIYPAEQARHALGGFFTTGNLTALRDLALRVTAREVEGQLDEYIRSGNIVGSGGVAERIMVAVDHRPNGKALIRRGWRLAAALKAELLVVHVEQVRGRRRTQAMEDERQLRSTLQLADELGATVIRLRGTVAEQLIECIQARHVSHLVVGQPTHGRLAELFRGSVPATLLREVPGLDVHIMASEGCSGRTRRTGRVEHMF